MPHRHALLHHFFSAIHRLRRPAPAACSCCSSSARMMPDRMPSSLGSVVRRWRPVGASRTSFRLRQTVGENSFADSTVTDRRLLDAGGLGDTRGRRPSNSAPLPDRRPAPRSRTGRNLNMGIWSTRVVKQYNHFSGTFVLDPLMAYQIGPFTVFEWEAATTARHRSAVHPGIGGPLLSAVLQIPVPPTGLIDPEAGWRPVHRAGSGVLKCST